MDLFPVPCDSAGYAIQVVYLARKNCLLASYHPSGGDTCKVYKPVTHTVWVMGAARHIEIFKDQLYLQSEKK